MISWLKNSHGGYRSVCGQFYLQQSPKKFYHLFAKQGESWKRIAGPFRNAQSGQSHAQELAAA